MKLGDILISIFQKIFGQKPVVTQVPSPQPITVPTVPPAQKPPVVTPYVPTPPQKLYAAGVACMGIDASPNDVAPDEYGCMETVDNVYKKAFGTFMDGTLNHPTVSTTLGYRLMSASKKFQLVAIPEPGDIIISPTGYGHNSNMPNGHVGVVVKYGILSNNSFTGKFEENYTLQTWKNRYSTLGGYPVRFFRPL